jgi:hypothetical protein
METEHEVLIAIETLGKLLTEAMGAKDQVVDPNIIHEIKKLSKIINPN